MITESAILPFKKVINKTLCQQAFCSYFRNYFKAVLRGILNYRLG